MSETIKTIAGVDIGAAIELGAMNAAQQAVNDGEPLVVLPKNMSVESLAPLLDPLAPRPRRKKGRPVFVDAPSFQAYVNDHKDMDSHLYVDVEAPAITAVLDHHLRGDSDPGNARWGEHVAGFAPPLDPDWTAWTGRDNELAPQMAFAQFVEDQIPNIVEPDGAELLELVQDLSMRSDLTFKRSERLQSGALNFQLADEVRDKLGREGVELPAELTVSLPIFRRGARITIVAKTRFRLAGGELKLGYHLHRPFEAVDEAFTRLVDAVVVETKLPALYGKP